MSGIFGIYRQDKQPVNVVQMERMANSIAHRGPDGTRTIQKGHIAFGHSMFKTTPEAQHELLPYVDTETDLFITADARIDNREELEKSLGFAEKSGVPDSVLILEAFKKWGTDSFKRLIGDFSFAIWNPCEQRLICVRDYIGVRPFYYHFSSPQFLFSSEIKQLAEHPDVLLTPNIGMVAEYLTFSLRSKTETLYDSVMRLAPGSFLVLSATGDVTITRYWSFQSGKRIWYKKTSDYTEHFLEVFKQAVSSKLRSIGQVSATLSGGLDSSSVVAMACNIQSERNLDKPEIYSMVFPGLSCDEQLYIDSVAQKYQFHVHKVPLQNYIASSSFNKVQGSYEMPYPPNLMMSWPLKKIIAENGSRIVLSGLGGDEWFTGTKYIYLDLIQAKRWSDLVGELTFSFQQDKFSSAKALLINVLWPFTPVFVRKMLCNQVLRQPSWLCDDFFEESKIEDRIRGSDVRIGTTNLADLFLCQVTATGGESYALENQDRYHAFFNIEHRAPFLDRRVAEFALSIPGFERYRGGCFKYLFRDSSNPLLPELVKDRYDKAEFSFCFNREFCRTKTTNLAKDLRIAEKGWVDETRFLEKISSMQDSMNIDQTNYIDSSVEVWFALAIEQWYREVFL